MIRARPSVLRSLGSKSERLKGHCVSFLGKAAVRVQALAGNVALCPWARHFTLTVPLSTQVCKWVLLKL